MPTFVQNSYQIELKDPHFYTLGQKNKIRKINRNDIDKNLHKKIERKITQKLRKNRKKSQKIVKNTKHKKAKKLSEK